jgi:hypothetical protein
MGRAAGGLHVTGNHRSVEQCSPRQPSRPTPVDGDHRQLHHCSSALCCYVRTAKSCLCRKWSEAPKGAHSCDPLPLERIGNNVREAIVRWPPVQQVSKTLGL